MTCDACRKSIQGYPCACGYQPKQLAVQPKTMLVDCATPGCFTQIKIKIADYETANLECIWCQSGTSHAKTPHDWPSGMPNPSLPWPWMTEEDREKKLRLPYWKERLHRHADLYKDWMRT